MKQLTAPSRTPAEIPASNAASLPLVTRFRDPDQPYEDLIVCERDCVRCSYAATLDCDGNCGSCPRQTLLPVREPGQAAGQDAAPG